MSFIREIENYAMHLQSASHWGAWGESLAYVNNGEHHYIYEFYCYMRILEDLLHNYELQYIPGDGDHPHKFPQAASHKKGKPKFIAKKDGKAVFQICSASKVNCKYPKEDNNPDISFQTPEAGDLPECEELIMVLDAKFQEKEGMLDKNEVYGFAYRVYLYKLNKQDMPDVIFETLNGLEGNCLLTNGTVSEIHDELLVEEFIKAVEKFGYKEDFVVRGCIGSNQQVAI